MKEQVIGPRSGIEVEEQIKLCGHKWHISCIGFSTNGVYFASGSWDKQVKIWDLRVLTTSSQVGNQSNCHEAPVTTLSWFPNVEFLLASGSADNSVRIWNSESGERLSVLQEHTGWVLGSSFNSSGTILATSSWDKTIGIWDINSLKLSQVLPGHAAGVWKCVFRSMVQEDNILCSASEDSSMKIWDLRAGSTWQSVANLVGAHDDAIRCCAWSPCGNYIAAGSSDSKISVWDIREHKPLSVLQGHTEMVTDIKFLPVETQHNSHILVSVGDTTCRFWGPFASSGSKQMCSLRQHDLDYEVESLDVSPDGTLLATGGRDNKIVLSTVNINEAEFGEWNTEETNTTSMKHQYVEQNVTDMPAKIPTRKVSAKSSALYVDGAVHQNEMLESERAKKIAKQTVKMKISGTSDILQNKLLEMKFSKNAPSSDEKPGDKDIASPFPEEGNKNKADYSKHERPALKPIIIPERDYNFAEDTLSSDGATNGQSNPEAIYQNGLILNSVTGPAGGDNSNEVHNKARLVSTVSTNDSLNTEIEDVANELIRISEEQQSYDEKF